MVILWLLDVAYAVLAWFLTPFAALPLLNLPAALSIQVPVPFLGASGVSLLNTWAATAITVAIALVLGKILQWFYSLIPFKAT